MKKITIIGCGIMGKIFLSTCQKFFSNAQIQATVKSGENLEELRLDFPKVVFTYDNKQAVNDSDLIILAVKPQNFLEVVDEIRGLLRQDTLVISVMAGVNLEKIKNKLEVKKIFRTMPNLGARVGKSMTVWTCSNEVDEDDKKTVVSLLNLIGKELFVDSEERIDKATAVSGSGPGFFYFVVEKWLKAVQDFGFTESEAKLLLFQTIDGSNNLLQLNGEISKLCEQVSSKGGTTEAGLGILKEADLESLWIKTLQKAFLRARELTNA